MTLADAIEAHIQSSMLTSAFGDAREVLRIGRLSVVRDAPGRKRPPRLQSIIITDVPADEAIKTIRSYEPTHWILCFINGMDANHESIKESYKAFGYRLNIRFPVFVRKITSQAPAAKVLAHRIRNLRTIDEISRLRRRKFLPPEAWQGDDPLMRVYSVVQDDQVIGWVESIRATKTSNWVSDMFVVPSHRGKGIGTSLLQSMLLDDHRHGVKNSALLSSSEGVKLYERAGYKQIGLMQIFAPNKKRG